MDAPGWRAAAPTVDEVKAGKRSWFTCRRGDPHSVFAVEAVIGWDQRGAQRPPWPEVVVDREDGSIIEDRDGDLWCSIEPPEVPT